MRLKSLAISLIAASPACAQTPPPTLAGAQAVIKIIASDPVKLQAYCELNKLDKQMQAAFEKNDAKTLEALNPQAEALVNKLGPEYPGFMQAVGAMDENSADGKGIYAALDTLDQQCK